MSADDRISFLVLEAQKRIFRLAERDHGLSLKAVSLDSGIPYNSVRGYASGQTVLPVPALLKLVGVIPDALLSQLLDPVHRHIAENGGEDGDLDALACETAGYTADYVDAKSDGTVTPFERNRLTARAARIAAKAGRAAA